MRIFGCDRCDRPWWDILYFVGKDYFVTGRLPHLKSVSVCKKCQKDPEKMRNVRTLEEVKRSKV